MHIKLTPIAQHDGDICTARIESSDGHHGEAFDCDLGRWVIQMNIPGPTMHPLDGCFPADNVAALAYAIRECVTGATTQVMPTEYAA